MRVMPEGYGQVNFIFSGSGVPTGAQCTLGIDVTVYEGTILALATELHDNWGDNIMPQLSSAVSLDTTLVKYGPASTGPSAFVSGLRPGGAAATQTSPNVTYIVQKLTEEGGRSGKGRLYVPGVVEAAVDAGGIIPTANVNAMTAAFGTFLTRLAAFDVGAVVLHESTAPITTPTGITSFQCESKVATQRRRNRR